LPRAHRLALLPNKRPVTLALLQAPHTELQLRLAIPNAVAKSAQRRSHKPLASLCKRMKPADWRQNGETDVADRAGSGQSKATADQCASTNMAWAY
jgi:hypothetical protein